MKYFLETYGCQMNIAESAALSLAAREMGWVDAANADDADLVLLNTCSVRATAEQRVMGRLAHYAAEKKKREKPFSLVVAGCMADNLGEKLLESGADYLLGTSQRKNFPLVLEEIENDAKNAANRLKIGKPFGTELGGNEKAVFSFSPLHFNEENPYRSFVPIMHGCNNFCSYCIVPYLRGREISRDPDAILNEIRFVGEKGVGEVTLLGQNVNSYLWEGNEGQSVNFPGLLELIAANIDGRGVRWVRFLSSHPKDLSPETIKVLAENSCFCRHIHLCVQHGSNRILHAMNRRYTREQYLELVRLLREAMPDISLSTDILIGFPGETDEDFEEVLTLMEEVKFLYAYMYHYNPRKGTAAFDLSGRIDENIKRQRLSRVIALQKKHTTELLKSRIGAEVTVLIEGISKKNADELICRTERDEMVVAPFNAGPMGSFCKVTLSSLKGNTFRSVV